MFLLVLPLSHGLRVHVDQLPDGAIWILKAVLNQLIDGVVKKSMDLLRSLTGRLTKILVAMVLIHEKAMFAPIWQLAAMGGFGSRVEESGLGLISAYPFSGPYEDVKLKGK